MPTTTENALDTGAPDPEDWAGRRADARRNHERVLAAAAEVFTEHGLGATIPQVAARAGVGKATVYRSFPTKSDLVRALAQVHVDWLQDCIATALHRAESADAYAAVEAVLERITTRLAEDRLMIEVLSGAEGLDDPETTRRIDRLVELGVEQGSLREDATSTDLVVLVSGIARALIERDERDPGTWRRYARLALAALRP